MVQKSFDEFKLDCRSRIGIRLYRLLSFTLSNCGISAQEFADRAGVKVATINRLIKGSFATSFELVCWIEYIAELYNTESASFEIPPKGAIDDLLPI